MIYSSLEALTLPELKRQIEVGCRRVFLRVFRSEIANESYDRSSVDASISDAALRRRILRNRVILTWRDCQNDEVRDADALNDLVLGIGDALEGVGYSDSEFLSLLSEFAHPLDE